MHHILIIEPDKLLARTYAAVLEHGGFTASVAHGAQEAIQAADARKPDAVVLELQLATHDGIEFLHEFRSYVEWQAIPMVIQSTVTPQDMEPVQKALRRDLGVVTFLYKPGTSLKQLLRAVREAVRAREVVS